MNQMEIVELKSIKILLDILKQRLTTGEKKFLTSRKDQYALMQFKEQREKNEWYEIYGMIS